ncbi:putative cytochrome c oxidase polypeptide Va precurser [Danaus plexippus plexippus]|uniref:Cytochrome c oxidase polypeptide Va precurser n=1 Tax=Danaus plexippus plexippus TaxID=278856 RepID=A0A212EQS7_DANPL|nr:putative cytochrome c oxidase polypeptide Va precurser [Danaus plexippus plexippus]
MLRSASGSLVKVFKKSLVPVTRVGSVLPSRLSHGGPVESDEEFDCRLVLYVIFYGSTVRQPRGENGAHSSNWYQGFFENFNKAA